MEKSSSPSKLLMFLIQFLLLSQLLEARKLGDGYEYKHLLASDVDADDAAASSHLNLGDDALDRPSYAPPAPKPGPSPHPVLGCQPPQKRDGDGAAMQEPQQQMPTPPRDYYGRQQAEAAGHPSRPEKMMDVFRAFLDEYARQI